MMARCRQNALPYSFRSPSGSNPPALPPGIEQRKSSPRKMAFHNLHTHFMRRANADLNIKLHQTTQKFLELSCHGF